MSLVYILVSSRLVSSRLVSSRLIPSRLIASHGPSHAIIACHCIPSHPIESQSHRIASPFFPCPLRSCPLHFLSLSLFSSHPLSSYLILSHFISFYLILSHLIFSISLILGIKDSFILTSRFEFKQLTLSWLELALDLLFAVAQEAISGKIIKRNMVGEIFTWLWYDVIVDLRVRINRYSETCIKRTPH